MAREKSLACNSFPLGLPLFNVCLLALARSSSSLVSGYTMLPLDVNLNGVLSITYILVLLRLNIA